MRKLALLLIAPALILAGCSKNFIATDAQICQVWKPLYPSRQDKLTAGTAKQIAGNNAANESVCGYRPPPKPPQRVASANK